MKHRIFIFFLLIITLASINSYASCTKIVYAKFKQQNTWSDKMQVEMSFMTGYELNEATVTNNYESTVVYGVVFRGRKIATIIKLTTTTGCDMKVNCNCIENFDEGLEGIDLSGKEWTISFK